ncbi:hypothetical protein NMY22_g18158 [Coprinellus aureogranulatus]|nr:hypothetical protein NMY22_g18158 [Coprinellus aureogranulatus]
MLQVRGNSKGAHRPVVERNALNCEGDSAQAARFDIVSGLLIPLLPGCSVVHALDQVQDLIDLSDEREKVLSHITRANHGFDEKICTSYIEFLEELNVSEPAPSTGTLEVRTIANYTYEGLTGLGMDFSTRPSALDMDRLVSDLWKKSRVRPRPTNMTVIVSACHTAPMYLEDLGGRSSTNRLACSVGCSQVVSLNPLRLHDVSLSVVHSRRPSG